MNTVAVLLAISLVALCGGCATKPVQPSVYVMRPPRTVMVSIREWGIYSITGERRRVENSLYPELNRTIVHNPVIRFDDITDTIRARLGFHFGFTFAVTGLPDYGRTNYLCVVTHPKMVAPPAKPLTEHKWVGTVQADALGNGSGFIGYTFERPEELVTGPWAMHVFMGNKLMLRKSFTVIE